MFDLDDIRADLIDEGWSTEFTSVFDDGADGYPTYVGHRIRVSTHYWDGRILPKDVAPARLTGRVATAAELPLLFETLASIAGVASKHPFLTPSVDLKPISPLTPRVHRQPVLKSGMTAIEIADEMLNAGWGYSDSISVRGSGSSSGKLYRRFDFNRWDWHGKRVGSTVNIWHLASVNVNWDNIVYSLAQKSLQAWEDFPDSVPYINATGKLVEDVMKTRIVFGN